MPTSVASSEAVVIDVSCSKDALTVVLDDGRTVSVPLVWFPRLLNATDKQRKEWEFIGGGIGIHWEEIDEDISVASLLSPERFMRLANTTLQPTSRAQRKSKTQKNPRAARG
jgi:phosphosulfolactate phosphohydrolase-like enzyme